ncbi:MAG: hypothetical protein K5888_07430, partial [Lachnospiraceae bacterium]|nr:hypothetical protein [Lachnospiraceae bacterium]
QDDSPAKKADETLTLALNIVRSGPKTNIKNKGITLDTKNWVSFNSETYRKIDELVAMGVPVKFKYVDKGYDCTFTIPANFASKLESYCDKTKCIGFEALAFTLVKAGYNISYKKEKIDKGNNAKSIAETKAATAALLNSGADLMASQGFEQAANAVAVDSASKAQSGVAPQAGSFTPFAAYGGSQMRAESG